MWLKSLSSSLVTAVSLLLPPDLFFFFREWAGQVYMCAWMCKSEVDTDVFLHLNLELIWLNCLASKPQPSPQCMHVLLWTAFSWILNQTQYFTNSSTSSASFSCQVFWDRVLPCKADLDSWSSPLPTECRVYRHRPPLPACHPLLNCPQFKVRF